jgi:2'-5' RNA ligase
MRCFVAIDLPDDLRQMLARLVAGIGGVRPTPPQQLHLTLAFLGEVEEPTVALLGRELAAIAGEPFTVPLRGCGCFPDRRRPRVLWAGLEPVPRLGRLYREVAAAVGRCGITLEERSFTPHITLARLKPPVRPDLGAFLATSGAGLPLLPVASFHLYGSCLTPQGAVHTPLRSLLLAG